MIEPNTRYWVFRVDNAIASSVGSRAGSRTPLGTILRASGHRTVSLVPPNRLAAMTSAGPRLLGPADVRALAARLDVRPTKQRGQNFVIDANTVRRIVRDGRRCGPTTWWSRSGRGSAR